MVIKNYFTEKEIDLLKVFCIKQEELIALNDNYMRNYPCIGFDYNLVEGDDVVDTIYVTNPFVVYGEESEVDPVEYYGDSFINSAYTELGNDIVNNTMPYSDSEVDMLKRIFEIDRLLEKYN